MSRAVVAASKLVSTLLITLLIIGSVPTSAFAGVLTLSASSGQWGTSVNVTGNGWSGSQNAVTGVKISMGGEVRATCGTNGAGTLQSCSFTVPDLGAGTHTVSAVDGTTATNTGSANFQILDPTTSLSPTTGPGNTATSVTGSGFKALATMAFAIDGTPVTPTTPCVTSTTGTFSGCSVTVPFGEQSTVVITASDNNGRTVAADFARTLVKGTFTLNPTAAAWGTTVTVSGSGWTPGKTGGNGGTGPIVRFDGQQVTVCATSSSGAIAAGCTFAVPDTTPGAAQVTLTDQTNTFNNATQAFTINAPTITLSPTSGAGGSTLTVGGSGFRRDADVQLLFDDAAAGGGACRTNASGVFSGCSFVVPFRAAGTYTVLARDIAVQGSQRQDDAPFNLTLTPGGVSLSPTSGLGGTVVTVTGGGWTANGTAADNGPVVRFDGEQVARCATSGTGALSGCTFTVPAVAPRTGGYQVLVTDGTNPHNTNTATFTVSAPSITLGSTSGATGSSITVTGGGFRSGAVVEFAFGTTLSRSTCTATQYGALSGCSIIVPSLSTSSPVTVTGRDLPAGDAQRSAPSTNTYTASTNMTLSASEGVPGDRINVEGTGFNASQAVELRWGNPAVAIPQTNTCGTNASGALSNCFFFIPAGTAGGPQTIQAAVISGTPEGSRKTASAPLDVYRPTALAVAPVTAVYGDTATLSATLTRTGTTSAPSSEPVAGRTVRFSVNGTTVGTAETGSNGVATLTNVSLGKMSVAGSPHSGAITAVFAATGYDRGSNGAAAVTTTRKTISGSFTALDKTYDGAATATIDQRSLNGVLAGDTVNLAGGSATFADKIIGADKAVSGTGFSLGGGDADNYTLASSSLTTTGTITPKAATIAFTAADKTYDGTTSAQILTRSVTGIVAGDDVRATGGSAAFGNKNAANGKTVSGAGFALIGGDAANYTFNSAASTAAAIAPRALAVTATAQNKVYDRTRAATVSLGDNRLEGDNLTVTHGPATFSDALVGEFKTVSVPDIAVSGTDAGNYTANTSTTASAHITRQGVEVTFTADDKIYDGSTVATIAGSQLAGVRDGDLVGVTGGIVFFDNENVGTGRTVRWSGFTLNGADASNYTLAADSITASADITRRSLLITATGINRVYDGTTNASVTLTDNRVEADTLTLSYATAEYQTDDAAADKAVAVIGISVTGTDAGNYTWNEAAATTATISQRPLTVTVLAQDKVYDATTAADVALGDNRIGEDALTVTKAAANFDTKNAGSAKTVTASGLALVGADAHNYSVPATATGTANVTAKSLVASFSVADKVYDRLTSATVTSNALAGVAANDDVSISGGIATFANKNVAASKTATITDYSLTGADAANYTANTTATAPAAITPRAILVSATGVTRVYDGTNTASATLSDNRIAGDVLSSSYAAATFNDKHAAAGKPVSVTGITISGDDAGNYTANNTAATTAGIVRRDLQVGATGVNKVYDRLTSAAVTLTDDRVSGDLLSASYVSAAFNTRTVGAGKPVAVQGITIVGDDAGNYSVNPTAATTADITRRPLTVSATGIDRVYDRTTSATVTLSDNRVSGDVLTAVYGAAAFNNKNVSPAKPVSVSGIAISGTDAGNYTVNETAATTAAITPKALLVSATGVDKVYDGTRAATVTLSDNRIDGDILAADYAAASFSDKNVAGTKAVSVTGIGISGADAGNYAANTVADATAAITRKPVTAAFTAADKVYDGTTVATVGKRTVEGKVGDDAVSLTAGSASFATKGAAATKNVTWTGFALTGDDAANYNLTNDSASATAAVTRRVLAVNATAENKRYDGTPSATVTLGDDRVGGDALTLSHAPAQFDNKNVGVDKDVTVSNIAISGGADAGNYNLGNATATAKAAITAPDALTVTFTARDKVYDGNTGAQVAAYELGGVKSGDTVTLTGGSVSFGSKTAAAGKTVTWSGFTLSGADASNYSLGAPSATAPATISPRPLTVTATAANRTYTGFTAAAVSMTSAQLVAGDVVTFGATSSSFNNKNVGTGKTVTVSGITHSGADTANYTLANTGTSTTADITPRPLTVTATAANKVYDGSTSAQVTLLDNRAVASDDLTISSDPATFATKTVANAKTVSVTGIAISGLDASNYTLSSNTTTASANITHKPLTVAATASSKVYDRTNQAAAQLSTNDRVAGDTVNLLFSSATFSDRLAGNAKNVTVSGISLGGADAPNYALQNVSAATTANITPKPLTVSASGADRVYDGTMAATVTLATADRIGADVVNLAHTSAAFATRTAGTGKTITVSGISISGADAANYALQNQGATATATISRKPVSVAAAAVNRVYNATSAATVTLSVPLQEAVDTLTVTSDPATFADKNVGNAKTVTASGVAISGADAVNYLLSSAIVSTTASITAKNLTVTAAGLPKVYDGSLNGSAALSSADRLGDDVLTFNSATPTFTTKTAGLGKTLSVADITMGGTDRGNYNLLNTSAATTADITRKQLTVTASGRNKVYDGTPTARVALATTDLVGSDEVTLNHADATYVDKAAADAKAITVTGISIDGPDHANYALQNAGATTAADITRAPLTATFTAEDKTYDQSAGAVIASEDLDGIVPNDRVALAGATAAFGDKHAGADKTVTVGGYSLTGDDAANYSVNATGTTTATIRRLDLTAEALAENKAYDGTNAATVTLLDNRLEGDDITLASTGATFDTRHIGEAKTVTVAGITISMGADKANYRLLNETATASATIFRGDRVTVDFAVADKVYDGTAGAVVTRFELDGIKPGDDVTLTPGTVAFEDADAGSHVVTWSGFELTGDHAANYELAATSESTTAQISRKSLTVVASGTAKTYDASDHATVTLSTEDLADGDVRGEDVVLGHADATFVAGANAGEAKAIEVTGISLTGEKATNYTLSNETAQATATIGRRPLTIKADPKAYVNGNTPPALTSTPTGFATGEGLDNLTGALVHTVRHRETGDLVVPASTTPAGVYTITPGGLASDNYDITFVTEDLTVGEMAATTAYKPNGMVSLDNSTYVGSGVINKTGTNQTVTASVARTAKRTFFIRVRNDGKATDSLKVEGCGSGAGHTVTYLAGTTGTTSITGKVVDGSYQFANVAPNAQKTFRAVVKVGSTAKVGATRSCAVTVTSANRTLGADTVKINVKTTR